MSTEKLSITYEPKKLLKNSRAAWLSWCRLCAKQNLNDQEMVSIFDNNDRKSVSELIISIGKYFWINIKAEDEISQCLCGECKQLLEELIIFTDRVNKVQTLFCLLKNINPSTIEEANRFRSQYGLIEEGWQHIKAVSTKVKNNVKSLLINQAVQTECVVEDKFFEKATNQAESFKALEQKDEKENNESQMNIKDQHIYEYIVHSDHELNLEMQYVGKLKEEMSEEVEELESEDIVDSVVPDGDDLYKLNLDNEKVEVKLSKKFKIVSPDEEVEVEYQDYPQLSKQKNDDMDGLMEVLEEEVEDIDYVNTKDSKSEININAFEMLKSKRGRPVGSKKLDTGNITYRFECKECKRRYKNPNIFRKHMVTAHDVIVELPYCQPPTNSCNICNKTFLTQSSLKTHMRQHLPDELKLKVPCPYCDRKFSQIGAMKQHVNGIHHQMKPYICDQCGRACKTMAALTEHQLVHTNECPFECDVCHKRFKNKPRLKSHMDTHTISIYKCPECDLELNTKRTLLQHRLVHSDVKRFKCEFCEAAFKRSKALKNHLILHSGLKPYKCTFCDRSFSNGSNCRAHKKRTHPKELAEQEANGKAPERTPIPRLEELKAAKRFLVQPRRVKRSNGSLLKLLHKSEICKQENSLDCEDLTEVAESCEACSEVAKSEIDETESIVDNPGEECEETIIYEIIDEI